MTKCISKTPIYRYSGDSIENQFINSTIHLIYQADDLVSAFRNINHEVDAIKLTKTPNFSSAVVTIKSLLSGIPKIKSDLERAVAAFNTVYISDKSNVVRLFHDVNSRIISLIHVEREYANMANELSSGVAREAPAPSSAPNLFEGQQIPTKMNIPYADVDMTLMKSSSSSVGIVGSGKRKNEISKTMNLSSALINSGGENKIMHTLLIPDLSSDNTMYSVVFLFESPDAISAAGSLISRADVIDAKLKSWGNDGIATLVQRLPISKDKVTDAVSKISQLPIVPPVADSPAYLAAIRSVLIGLGVNDQDRYINSAVADGGSADIALRGHKKYKEAISDRNKIMLLRYRHVYNTLIGYMHRATFSGLG